MRYLHEYAEDYYYQFVDSPQDAQVIITNDVFPKHVLNLGVPLVKRMCGPFWKKSLSFRNEILNAAAQQADKVIFITKYSRQQYIHCFGDNLKDSCVVTHWVDPKVFNQFDVLPRKHNFMFGACATNWSRKEKRLDALVAFAECHKDIEFTIIGTVEQTLPSNFIKMGYLDNPYDIAYILNSCDGFINLSYRDAATKTVPQAISCGLPVLYADSGGVNEMVSNPIGGHDFGVAIKDSHCLDMEDDVPPLNIEDINIAYQKFRKDFEIIKSTGIELFDRKLAFRKMLDGYFGTITELLKD
jgi:glycosyltransferase involved in cell wall biosynthesis